MAIALDIIVIAVIAAFGWKGARRGMPAAAVSIGITLVAALVAFFASAPVAAAVYDSNIKDSVVEALQSGLDSIDAMPIIRNSINEHFNIEITDDDLDRIAQSDDVKSELQSVAAENGKHISFEEIDEKWNELISSETLTELVGEEVPEDVIESVADTLRNNEDNITTVIQVVCSADSESAAKKVEKSILRDKITGMIRALMVFVLFAATAAVLRLIYFMLSLTKIIPPMKKLLQTAGLLIGVAEGILLFIVLGACLSGLIDNSYGVLEAITQDTIDKTFIFKLFVR